MSATLNKDGTIDFGTSKGLLSPRDIANQAFAILGNMQAKRAAFDEFNRVNELRKSCGAEPVKLKMTIGIRGVAK